MYLRINLIKDVQELYTENYKTLQREIRDNLNKEKYTISMDSCLLVSKIYYFVPIANLPKLIFRFNAIPIKILLTFLKKSTADFKIYMEKQS